MGELHELLAAENELKNAAKLITEETVNTFLKKPDHFIGVRKTLRMFDENRANEEASAEEERQIVTTVSDKLRHTLASLSSALDATAQKEKTNQAASGNIVIGGKTVISDVPATLLLTIEKELVALRRIYSAIPTMQPGIKWVPATDLGENIYRTESPEVKSKTEKTRLHKELSPATKEHKAQIETWTEDRPVGQYERTYVTGMITPARKSVLLGRIDTLLMATKKARARANKEKVVDIRIGKSLFDFINA